MSVLADERQEAVVDRPAVLKVGSLDQQQKHHLGTWWKCTSFSFTPDPHNQRVWGWGPACLGLTSPPGDSDAQGKQRTTEIQWRELGV